MSDASNQRSAPIHVFWREFGSCVSCGWDGARSWDEWNDRFGEWHSVWPVGCIECGIYGATWSEHQPEEIAAA